MSLDDFFRNRDRRPPAPDLRGMDGRPPRLIYPRSMQLGVYPATVAQVLQGQTAYKIGLLAVLGSRSFPQGDPTYCWSFAPTERYTPPTVLTDAVFSRVKGLLEELRPWEGNIRAIQFPQEGPAFHGFRGFNGGPATVELAYWAL